MSSKTSGTIKWFKNVQGYGFAVNEAGDDVFVHYKEIIGEGFKTLAKGQRIEFVQIEGKKGLQATQVKLLETN